MKLNGRFTEEFQTCLLQDRRLYCTVHAGTYIQYYMYGCGTIFKSPLGGLVLSAFFIQYNGDPKRKNCPAHRHSVQWPLCENCELLTFLYNPTDCRES